MLHAWRQVSLSMAKSLTKDISGDQTYAYQKVAIHLQCKKIIGTRPQKLCFIQKCTGQPRFFTNILLKQYEY